MKIDRKTYLYLHAHGTWINNQEEIVKLTCNKNKNKLLDIGK